MLSDQIKAVIFSKNSILWLYLLIGVINGTINGTPIAKAFRFIHSHWRELFLLAMIALLINTFLNALILRFLGRSIRESMYGGALLANISEFSFVLATIGLQSKIITIFSYQMTIALIFITLLVSPFWVTFFRSKLPAHKPQCKGSLFSRSIGSL